MDKPFPNPIPPTEPLGFGPFFSAPVEELPTEYIAYLLERTPEKLNPAQHQALMAILCNRIGIVLNIIEEGATL